MTVHQIIKRAIERLKNEGKLLTPDAYAGAFCVESKKAGILVEDCNHVDKYFKLLDKNVQAEIKQYRVRTTQELVRFLISKMNQKAINAILAKKRESALSLAINRGYIEVVQMLIDYGVDKELKMNLEEVSPLYHTLGVISQIIKHHNLMNPKETGPVFSKLRKS